MKIIPAIDLKGGKCVRLKQGRMDDETVYAHDPMQVAAKWQESGAELIHIVDLDGAVGGSPISFNIVKNIGNALKVPLQIGGGIRERATAERYLSLSGVERIILGTVAHSDPGLVKDLSKDYPGRIAVGIDAKDGMVATEGWVNVTKKSAIECAKGFEDVGVGAIIYTDISRDGMMSGPNIAATMEIASAVSIPVIASGGVSSMRDIDAYAEAEKEKKVDLEGMIIGKALYTGAIELRHAVVRARNLQVEKNEK
jgi:phosphoribosylformimino-5-aminoimidazole carboxamide ribotide isomerase